MTVTEASRDVTVADAAATEPTPTTGLAAVVGSGDPRAVGKLFVGTSLLFLLLAGVTGVLAGLDMTDLDSAPILGSGSFAQVVTLHQVAGLFLVLLPLLLGLALVVVPLQVGASTVAFPRAAAVAYWAYLVAGGIMVAAYIADGGPFGGDAEAVGLFVAAFVVLIAALCTVGVSVATTVLALRAPGMTLRRTPLFAWSMMVAVTIWLLTLPVLAGLLVLYYTDITYADASLFGGAGAADHLFDQIRWVFWQPALYAFAVPALGIIGDIVPVFAQRRHYRHTGAMVLIGLFGAVSFGAWAQLGQLPISVTTGEAVAANEIVWLGEPPLIAASALALVALLGLLGLWTLTLLKGRMRLSGPLLLALVAGLLLLVGVAAGIGTVVPDLDLMGTTWITGQAYAVLGGTLVAAVAGLVFWAPKLYGTLFPDGLAKLLAPLFAIGGLLLAVPYAIAGLLNQPWWVGSFVDQDNTVDEESTVEVLNLLGAVGGAIVVAGGALVLVTLALKVLGRTRSVDGDPWEGHTLEWTTTSPPPVGHFAGVIEVTSEAPLYDQRHGASGTDVVVPAKEEVSA